MHSPGVQIMHIFDALSKEPSIRLVTVRHEQGTTYMAMGYARTTGKIGVALVVPGPGALNASAGLGTAYAASLPVVLVSGQMERSALGKYQGALHEVQDQLEVFRPITKSAERVLEVAQIPDAVHSAMTLAASGRQRPTEVEIPWDVLPLSGDAELPERAIITPQQPDASKIKDAAELLAGAKHPVIWAGGGAINADASNEVLKLGSNAGHPCDHNPGGKGRHPRRPAPCCRNLLLRSWTRLPCYAASRCGPGCGQPVASHPQRALGLWPKPEAYSDRCRSR